MINPQKIIEGLWTFPIRLPDNPLKWLNCYAIKPDKGRNLLVDTGFGFPECAQDLFEGISALGLNPENTDVFISHMHSDHSGNAGRLYKLGYSIFIGRIDYQIQKAHIKADWIPQMERYLQEGLSYDFSRLNKEQANAQYDSGPFEAKLLDDGDYLCYGDFTLKCVLTPGHTPGHMCLYDQNKKLMFLGDHVLFDITPNITMWPEMEDSLGSYIESLKRLKTYKVDFALPGHRGISDLSLGERIDMLLTHHGRRLGETEMIISHNPDFTAYEIAARLSWEIRSSNWDDFPAMQKWFAFGETLAHLDYLVSIGRIVRQRREGRITYHMA